MQQHRKGLRAKLVIRSLVSEVAIRICYYFIIIPTLCIFLISLPQPFPYIIFFNCAITACVPNLQTGAAKPTTAQRKSAFNVPQINHWVALLQSERKRKCEGARSMTSSQNRNTDGGENKR